MKSKHKRKGITLGGVPVYETSEFTYILLPDLSTKYRAEFAKWMYGQTSSTVHGEVAIYSWDWERWYEMKTKGTPTYFD